MYRKIEIRFDIYGTEYFKSVIKGFKFVFSDFFSLQIKPLLCNRIDLKNWIPLQYLQKVSNEREEPRGLHPTIQKDEKSAFFYNSVNSIISSSKFSFKEKDYLKLIISFNFSNKTFMQKGQTRGHLIFFSFGTQNQFAYLQVYYIASIN